MVTSLESILSDEVVDDKPAVEDTPPETETPPADDDSTKDTGDDEAGEPKDKDSDNQENDAEPPPDQKTVSLAALHGERDRRIAAERALEDHKKSNPPEKPEPTSMLEDETKARQEILDEVQQGRLEDRFETSLFFANREFSDLADKVEAFKTLAADNPELKTKVRGAISPYHEMVDIVTRHERVEKLENSDKLYEDLKAKAKADAMAEIEADAEKKANVRSQVPTSLAGDESKGGLSSGKQFTGPTPLKDILKS